MLYTLPTYENVKRKGVHYDRLVVCERIMNHQIDNSVNKPQSQLRWYGYPQQSKKPFEGLHQKVNLATPESCFYGDLYGKEYL